MHALRLSAGNAARRSRRFGGLMCLMLVLVPLAASLRIDPAHATQVVAVERRSYLVRDDGTLWAWGFNDYGQLGDGTTTMRPAPIPVMSGVRAVSRGILHTVALKLDGSVWASSSRSRPIRPPACVSARSASRAGPSLSRRWGPKTTAAATTAAAAAPAVAAKAAATAGVAAMAAGRPADLREAIPVDRNRALGGEK